MPSFDGLLLLFTCSMLVSVMSHVSLDMFDNAIHGQPHVHVNYLHIIFLQATYASCTSDVSVPYTICKPHCDNVWHILYRDLRHIMCIQTKVTGSVASSEEYLKMGYTYLD